MTYYLPMADKPEETQNHLPNGARVIVLKEGKREFSSWIRVRTGEIEQSTVYPNSFQKDDWRKRKLAK